MKELRLILGDQLNHQHTWYQKVNADVTYVMMEMHQESEYVTHHIQKIVAFFAAMRAFSNELKNQGHQVIYWDILDENNTGRLHENLNFLIQTHGFTHFSYQFPDEYRLDESLKEFCLTRKLTTEVYDSEHFITHRSELAELFQGKKQFLMETFYRHIRKKTGILMNNAEPEGGKWNFDADNRQKYDAKIPIPRPFPFLSDQTAVYQDILKAGLAHFGLIQTNQFIWPVTSKEAELMLNDFVKHRLPWFGTYQDALYDGDAFMFHSRISFALNVKLIHPLHVVQVCVDAWKENKDKISLNQLEGFIRQIIGWREYMRGIYWLKMPDYRSLNFFQHNSPLPTWFWTGKTKMNCLSKSIGQSLEHAYAHHIQRLMVTGNFMLLSGLHPDAIDTWYLGIYIDAIEWVEITNTRGMSQFADGGIVGSKPYVSSAAYINKMGNYCSGCHYNYKERTTQDACPFNSLYWHFHARNRHKLEKNPRIGMMYRTWDNMAPDIQKALLDRGDFLLEHLEEL